MRDKGRKLTVVGVVASVFLFVGFAGWIVYTSLPAFAIFFISMFVIIFIQMKREATKISKSPIDFIIRRERLPGRRKLVLCIVMIFGVAVALSLLIPLGFKTYPQIVIFGFISFAAVMMMVIAIVFACLLRVNWRYARRDFGLWKKSMFGSSLADKYQAARQLESLNDPVAEKWWAVATKIAKALLLLWAIGLVIFATVVVLMERIGK